MRLSCVINISDSERYLVLSIECRKMAFYYFTHYSTLLFNRAIIVNIVSSTILISKYIKLIYSNNLCVITKLCVKSKDTSENQQKFPRDVKVIKITYTKNL